MKFVMQLRDFTIQIVISETICYQQDDERMKKYMIEYLSKSGKTGTLNYVIKQKLYLQNLKKNKHEKIWYDSKSKIEEIYDSHVLGESRIKD